MSKKEVISFRRSIVAGEMVVLSERIKDNGQIEELRVRFYAGQEKSLRVRPYVEHHARQQEDFLTYQEETDQYLSGEDDSLVFPVNLEVQYDDFVKLHVINTSVDFAYSLSVDVVISYNSMEGI